MSENWTFLTNHGAVFLYLSEHVGDTVRRIADELGLAERTVAGIIADLREGGYLLVEKQGKNNVYAIDGELSMRHPVVAGQSVSRLIDALAKRRRTPRGRSPRTSPATSTE